ncbi:MAG: YdcF family protein, partial [Oscillibacter sp.]|nr:YdcF family protein [Oscillibacter sp.]
GLGALCILWMLLTHFEEKHRIFKLCKRVFLVSVCALAVLICSLEVLLLSYGEKDRSALPADAVIVLGAGVNGQTPSAALRSRIDAAAAYIQVHPGIPVVLSGGQGSGEDISEAECMYHALREDFAGTVFLLEERSTSTAENFAYSKEMLAEYGLDTENTTIAVVTNDFHIYRSRLIAEREGLATLGVPAELPWWWLTANYYLREAFALVKTVLFD